MLVLGLAGVGVASYLSATALFGEQDLVCGPVGDCHTVQESIYADVAGIPVAVLGLGLYLALLAVLIARRWRFPDSTLLMAWTFSLALAGVLYSGYLTYLELFVIDAICVWCVTSATIVSVLFVLSIPDARRQWGRA
jgi:uncharacterized membrane protein